MSEAVSEATPVFPLERRPRCPPFIDVKSKDDLMPYLESVAKRKHQLGSLHACWDLQKGEKLLLRADNWHDPMVIEACEEILQRYGVNYEIEINDRGPLPELEGHHEIEIFLEVTKELAHDMDRWIQMDKDGTYDKILWGFGGPVLSESKMKIARMPFITPELLATPAHTIPEEILWAIDAWTDRTIKNATHVRITDPEGTDISYPLPPEYFNKAHTEWNNEAVSEWWPNSPELIYQYMPGHITARPLLMFDKPGVDAVNGVIAGTMNHVGPYPQVKMQVEDCKITEIEGGGLFGEKLRGLQDQTADIQYPGYPGKGLLWMFEVSIGTNPKIHRPRHGYLTGWVCGMYERMRSGVIHLGFGSVISSSKEIEAALAGHPTGHWHIHLNFATVSLETADGEKLDLIHQGRLCALDDPEVRKIAEKYGDPDRWLEEDWIPAVPGLNCEGSYESYAQDPTAWTMAELEICRNQHPLFMRMVNAEHGPGAFGNAHANCNH